MAHAERVTIGPQGRFVIPAAMRRHLGPEPGSIVLVRVEGDALTLERQEAALDRLRVRYAKAAGGPSVVDELIAERREEAHRDAGPAWVLDASALLALLFDEPGGEMVERGLTASVISAVNLSEVMDKSLERGVGVDNLRDDLEALGVDVRSFDVTPPKRRRSCGRRPGQPRFPWAIGPAWHWPGCWTCRR